MCPIIYSYDGVGVSVLSYHLCICTRQKNKEFTVYTGYNEKLLKCFLTHDWGFLIMSAAY